MSEKAAHRLTVMTHRKSSQRLNDGKLHKQLGANNLERSPKNATLVARPGWDQDYTTTLHCDIVFACLFVLVSEGLGK